MNRARGAIGLLVVFAGVCGCGDTPARALRDINSTRNEAADLLYVAHDDASARVLMDTKLEKLKKKWDTVKKRFQDFMMDKEDKRDGKEAYDANRQEFDATERRLRVGAQALQSRANGASVAGLVAAVQSNFPFDPEATWPKPNK
jgi:hypothetical protein